LKLTKISLKKMDEILSWLDSIPKEHFIELEKHQNKTEAIQKKFFRIWKKYNHNKTKHQKEFLKICNDFGAALQEEVKFDDKFAIINESYIENCDKAFAKIMRLKKKK